MQVICFTCSGIMMKFILGATDFCMTLLAVDFEVLSSTSLIAIWWPIYIHTQLVSHFLRIVAVSYAGKLLEMILTDRVDYLWLFQENDRVFQSVLLSLETRAKSISKQVVIYMLVRV